MLYHGTKIPPSRVLFDGLKPIDIEGAIRMVMKKYSIPGDLRYIFNDRIQDYVQRKRNHLLVYLTDNIDEAISYAEYGSNFVGLLEIEACELVGLKWKPDKNGYLYFVNLEGNREVKLPYVHPGLIVGWAELIFINHK